MLSAAGPGRAQVSITDFHGTLIPCLQGEAGLSLCHPRLQVDDYKNKSSLIIPYEVGQRASGAWWRRLWEEVILRLASFSWALGAQLETRSHKQGHTAMTSGMRRSPPTATRPVRCAVRLGAEVPQTTMGH